MVLNPTEVSGIIRARTECINSLIKVLEDMLNKAMTERKSVIAEVNELRAQLQRSVQDMFLDKKDEKLLNAYREKLKRYRNSPKMKNFQMEINAAVKEEEDINLLLQNLRKEDVGDMKILKDETQNLETEVTAIEALLRLVQQHKKTVFAYSDMQKLQQDFSKVSAMVTRNIRDLHLDQNIGAVKADITRRIESFSKNVERLVIAVEQQAAKP